MKPLLGGLLIGIAILGFFAWLNSRPGTAIVEATITKVDYVNHQYELVVNATYAFPNFPLFTMSQCPGHEVGQTVFVGVTIANGYGGKPIWDEAKLFKAQGIGFVP